jgi:hypothetical protein
MTRTLLASFALLLSLFSFNAPALAQDRELLGTYRDWNAFREVQDGNTVCYAVAIPDETQLSRRGRQRGDVYFFVTSWRELGFYNQVNVVIGYPLDEDSTPMIRIGGNSFEMFGRGDRAWLLDESETNALLAAMRGGSRMTVTGRSEMGTDSTDSYSLLGATAALEAASGACR